MSVDDSNTKSVRNRIIAACTGSLLTSFAVNPFDVARIRMQQSSAVEHLTQHQGNPVADATAKINPKALKPYTITREALSIASSGSGVQLGVNMCCKDAFWYPSSISYCVANSADPCAMSASMRQAKRGKPASTFGVLRNIVHDEGGLVLWRGVTLLLMQAVPANVIYFIAYENLRDSIKTLSIGQFQQLGPLVAGGLARALASSIVSPIELFKTRLQSIKVPQNQNAMSFTLKSIREMIQIDGYRSLWSGLGLTLWRDVPFSSIYWLVVEAVRSYSPERPHSHWEKFSESFASGIIGGVVASLVTTPFDVAKTRRQLGHSSCSSAHMSMPKFMGTIARTEGWQALFVGLAPRTFKVAPACAIMITSYEMGKRILQE